MTPPDETAHGELPQQIAHAIASMRSELTCIRVDLVNMGHRHAAACNAIGGVQHRCMTLATLITQIETIAKAKTASGELKKLPAQERPEEMELFAATAMPAAVSLDEHRRSIDERLKRSLHRANDHSLDDEEVMESEAMP